MFEKIKPFNCQACNKLLSFTWEVECDGGYGCTQCGLPFEDGEVLVNE